VRLALVQVAGRAVRRVAVLLARLEVRLVEARRDDRDGWGV
jgi:hypothetical protein